MTRSKSAATWLAVGTGSLGGHRFYLHGWRDAIGWLFPLPTLLGVLGIWRWQTFGQDDRLSWVLMPLLGLTISAGMLAAIVCGLTSDERWAARWRQPLRPTGWTPVLGVIVALLLGTTALMSAIAFSVQKIVETSFDPIGAPQAEWRAHRDASA